MPVAVPLVFAAAGVDYADSIPGVLAWRTPQFVIPTLAGLGSSVSLIIERRRRAPRQAEELPRPASSARQRPTLR